MIQALWAYRGFILGSVKRDFQARYRNSLLGAAWMVINPMAMITVYTVIFAKVMQTRMEGVDSTFAFSIYLCAGVLTWGFFADIVGRSLGVFLANANLLKKLNFPRLCLPVIVALNAGINFTIILTLFTLFLLLSGNFPGWPYLALFPLLFLQAIFALGLGITLGVLNVFFRDIGQLFGVVLQFWFWLTPIVYPSTVLPESVRSFMVLNPMANLMAGYQTILVQGEWPEWKSLWLVSFLGVVFCGVGLRLFRKHVGEMVDEL